MPDLYSNTALAGNTRKVQASTQFGTRKLAFLAIELTDVHVDYTLSNSILSQLVYALQQQVEIYGVGIPSGGVVTVIVADDTAPYNSGDSFADLGRNARLEAALTTAGITASVWNARLSGGGLNWD